MTLSDLHPGNRFVWGDEVDDNPSHVEVHTIATIHPTDNGTWFIDTVAGDSFAVVAHETIVTVLQPEPYSETTIYVLTDTVSH